MEYKPLDELRHLADVEVPAPRSMSRIERLERWAELLEREPKRRLRSLGEIEFKTPAERKVMRANDSPLAVAFADPVLRAEGLASDRLGDAIAFFELTESQAHRLLCSCMNGMSMTASRPAHRIRAIAKPGSRIMSVAFITTALMVGVPTLLYLLR
jgi:hypothetical protein